MEGRGEIGIKVGLKINCLTALLTASQWTGWTANRAAAKRLVVERRLSLEVEVW